MARSASSVSAGMSGEAKRKRIKVKTWPILLETDGVWLQLSSDFSDASPAPPPDFGCKFPPRLAGKIGGDDLGIENVGEHPERIGDDEEPPML